MTDTAGNDIISVLLEDHQEVRQLLTRVASATGDAKKTAFQELVSELARHETAEEEVLYPAVRRSVDGGDDLADARREEEHKGERLLADLEKRDVGARLGCVVPGVAASSARPRRGRGNRGLPATS